MMHTSPPWKTGVNGTCQDSFQKSSKREKTMPPVPNFAFDISNLLCARLARRAAQPRVVMLEKV